MGLLPPSFTRVGGAGARAAGQPGQGILDEPTTGEQGGAGPGSRGSVSLGAPRPRGPPCREERPPPPSEDGGASLTLVRKRPLS